MSSDSESNNSADSGSAMSVPSNLQEGEHGVEEAERFILENTARRNVAMVFEDLYFDYTQGRTRRLWIHDECPAEPEPYEPVEDPSEPPLPVFIANFVEASEIVGHSHETEIQASPEHGAELNTSIWTTLNMPVLESNVDGCNCTKQISVKRMGYVTCRLNSGEFWEEDAVTVSYQIETCKVCRKDRHWYTKKIDPEEEETLFVLKRQHAFPTDKTECRPMFSTAHEPVAVVSQVEWGDKDVVQQFWKRVPREYKRSSPQPKTISSSTVFMRMLANYLWYECEHCNWYPCSLYKEAHYDNETAGWQGLLWGITPPPGCEDSSNKKARRKK